MCICVCIDGVTTWMGHVLEWVMYFLTYLQQQQKEETIKKHIHTGTHNKKAHKRKSVQSRTKSEKMKRETEPIWMNARRMTASGGVQPV